MALNTSHACGGVLIYNAERILIYYDGVEMAFEMDSSLPHFKGNKKGRIYLTTHRVIFNCKDVKDTLQSFSMPFFTMSEIELEQPVFGANYIKGKVRAETNGNWEGSGKFKIWFNHGGAIDFGKVMLTAGKLASRNFSNQPPVYTPPSATAAYYQAPPPAYAPPGGQMYSFVPYQTFPTAPPTDGVYMFEAPPPYPGIDPNPTPYQAGPTPAYGYPGPQANGHSQSAAAAAKEAEANASGGHAYYDPANPHNIYMPQSAAPPPPYSETTNKKSD